MKRYLQTAILAALTEETKDADAAGLQWAAAFLKSIGAHDLFGQVRKKFYDAVGEDYNYSYTTDFFFDADGSLYVVATDSEGYAWKASVSIAENVATVGEYVAVTVAHPVKSFAHGGSVKVTDAGTVSGYLVRFTNDSDTDLDGEFFSAETDYGFDVSTKLPVTRPMLYHHGLDAVLADRKIGELTVTKDDTGLWVEGQLAMRDEYERAIYGMAKQQKLGWSSGANPHTVAREKKGTATHIKTWHIVEGSLTATPSEHRNQAVTKTFAREEISDAPLDPLPASFDVDAFRREVADAIRAMQEKVVADAATATEKAVDKRMDAVQKSVQQLAEQMTAHVAQLTEKFAALKTARELAAQKIVDRASPVTISDLIGQKTIPSVQTDDDTDEPDFKQTLASRYGKHAVGIGV